VARDRAHRLERRLREQCTHPARVFTFPRAQLNEVGGREDELDVVLSFRTREDDAAFGERLQGGRNGRDDEEPTRLCDAVEQLDARLRQPARVAELGERNESAGDLRGGIEALRGIDADTEPRDERVELRLREGLEDVRQAERHARFDPHHIRSTLTQNWTRYYAPFSGSMTPLLTHHVETASAEVGGAEIEAAARDRARRAEAAIFGRPERPRCLSLAVISSVAVSRRAAPSSDSAVKEESRAPSNRGADRSGVRLTWPGKRWREDCAGGAPASAARAHTLQTVEMAGDPASKVVQRLVHGDGLDVVGALAAEGLTGEVDLVYVDPPYASDRDYVAEARLDGPADGRNRRTLAYEDKWSIERGGVGAYLDMLAPRLEALTTLLSPRGTIWVHLDWRAAYLVRTILDEILGREAFRNEIVWRRAPNLGRQATSGQFGRTLDTLVVYGREKATLRPPTRLEPIEPNAIRWDEAKRPFTSAPRGDYTDASIAKLDAEGRVHRTASGRVYIKYFLVKNAEGVLCRERRVDALWTDVAPLRHAIASERTGYPTQKPRALLERIIACASDPGGIVVDGFAGSGTTAVAAHALGRRAILCDTSPVAIATARARLLREKAPLRIERVPGMTAPEAPVKVDLEVDAKTDRVRLVSPSEPLAWAIGTEQLGVFRSTWHAERIPGSKPTPAALEAQIPRGQMPRGGALHVRVYCDDGSVGRWSSRASAGKREAAEVAKGARAELEHENGGSP
jgi:DNA modification methylase